MNEKVINPDAVSNGSAHEPTTINGRAVGLCGLGLMTIIFAALLTSSGLLRLISPSNRQLGIVAPPVSRSTETPPLDPQQRKSRGHYEAEQRERLSTYGWVDRANGKVHIPIDRAMTILVQKNRGNK